jgi:hypothetical protein
MNKSFLSEMGSGILTRPCRYPSCEGAVNADAAGSILKREGSSRRTANRQAVFLRG